MLCRNISAAGRETGSGGRSERDEGGRASLGLRVTPPSPLQCSTRHTFPSVAPVRPRGARNRRHRGSFIRSGGTAGGDRLRRGNRRHSVEFSEAEWGWALRLISELEVAQISFDRGRVFDQADDLHGVPQRGQVKGSSTEQEGASGAGAAIMILRIVGDLAHTTAVAL
jgi:hypothetical protein